MKKTTKGALAAVAGGSLLFASAGSLAYWTDDSTVDGDSIESGQLDLSLPDCTVAAGTHDWQFDTSNAAFDPDVDTVVPGDTLTKVCDMTLTMVGSHMTAALDVDSVGANWDPASDAGLTSELVPTVVFLVDGAPYTAPLTTTSALPEDYTVRATITLTFPYGVEDNDSKSPLGGPALAAILENITVTATQQHDAA